MNILKLTLAATILLASPAIAADHPKAKRNTESVSMKSVEALARPGTGAVLIGGIEAKSVDWPASFYSAAAGSRCSATLVGPNALLLAAHCVGNGKVATIEFRNVEYSGKCTHAEEYNDGSGDDSADYALCRLTKEVKELKYESTNKVPDRIVKNNKLRLTGYGCTQPPPPVSIELPSGGNDGKFRIGLAKITAIPGEIASEPNTIWTKDQVAVCPGDSGGGAYIENQSIPSKRLLVSVNSRVVYDDRLSYLSSTSTAIALKFINAWLENSDNLDAKICGFNLSGPTCR